MAMNKKPSLATLADHIHALDAKGPIYLMAADRMYEAVASVRQSIRRWGSVSTIDVTGELATTSYLPGQGKIPEDYR
jgi:hypothetical protein